MSTKKPNLVVHSPSAARNRFKRRQPELVRGILGMALRGLGLDDQLAKYSFVARWQEIVGADLASRTLPEYIKNKVLYIRVPSSVWAQELSLSKQAIISRLQRITGGQPEVRDVRFVVGSEHSKSRMAGNF